MKHVPARVLIAAVILGLLMSALSCTKIVYVTPTPAVTTTPAPRGTPTPALLLTPSPTAVPTPTPTLLLTPTPTPLPTVSYASQPLNTSAPAIPVSATMPCRFHGSVKLDGAYVPDGTTIAATVEGDTYLTNTPAAGYGPSTYAVKMQPLVGKRYTEGATVVFKIGGVAAQQTATWISGGNLQLDLSASTQSPSRVTLHDGDSYDFSKGIRGQYSGGDFYYYDLSFWANNPPGNPTQRGLNDLGDIGAVPLAQVQIPASGYSRYGVPAEVGHTYVSLAEKGEEGSYVVFRVVTIYLDEVVIDFVYRTEP